MCSLLGVIRLAIDLYIWIVIAAAIMSWLLAFGVINRYNRVVATISDTLFRLTDPALQPIRKLMPNLGGVDISPLILWLILWFVEHLIFEEAPAACAPFLY